ncbi:MAG: Uma2 family endonuclease [Fimbriimonas sp.]
MAAPKILTPTAYEYLVHERNALDKHELVDGQIVAMAGASPTHNQINFNLTVAIGARLRGTSCRGAANDQKVRVDSGRLFAYPDLVIFCDQPRYLDEDKDVLLNPKVIVEVLSPSTELFDRGRKFALYQESESLQEYVLVSQDHQQVEIFRRNPSQDGKVTWSYQSLREGDLSLESVGVVVPIAEIFELVEFVPAAL